MSIRTTARRRTSALRTALAAVSLTAALTVTGRTDAPGGSAASDQGGAQPAASDPAAGPAADPDLADVPDPVAVVNGEEISKDEFARSYQAQAQQAAQRQSTGQEVDPASLRSEVAERLVGNRLLPQAAHASGVRATDADVDATLTSIAQQNGLGSPDEVVAALGQQGLSEDEVRAQAADQFALTAYIDREADVPPPSEEEPRAQYDQIVARQQAQAGGQADAMQTPPFEEVRDQLAQQVVSQREGEAAQALVTEPREKGDVEVHV